MKLLTASLHHQASMLPLHSGLHCFLIAADQVITATWGSSSGDKLTAGAGAGEGATCGGGRRLLATWCLDIADLFYQICWVLCYKSPNGCKRVVFRDYVDHYRDSRLHCNRFVTTATLNKRTIPFPWYWCCRTRSSWWQYHTLQSCPVMGSFGEMRSINLMRTTRWIFLWRYFTFFIPTTSKAGWCWSQFDLYFISPLLWLEGFSVASKSIVSRYFELPNKLLPYHPESEIKKQRYQDGLGLLWCAVHNS